MSKSLFFIGAVIDSSFQLWARGPDISQGHFFTRQTLHHRSFLQQQ